MSIAPLAFSSSAFSSSGVKMTYWPLLNSYPFTMSSFSTFSPSLEQTYCCFRRAPSFLWSQLKEMAAEDSPVENILTGTETRPKEMVAEPMEWALIRGYDTKPHSCPQTGPVRPPPPSSLLLRPAQRLSGQAFARPH